MYLEEKEDNQSHFYEVEPWGVQKSIIIFTSLTAKIDDHNKGDTSTDGRGDILKNSRSGGQTDEYSLNKRFF